MLLLLVCDVFLCDLSLFSLSLVLSILSVIFYCSYKCWILRLDFNRSFVLPWFLFRDTKRSCFGPALIAASRHYYNANK